MTGRPNPYVHLEIDYCIRSFLVKEGKYKGEVKRKLDERIVENKRKYRAELRRRNGKKYLYDNYGEIVNGGGDFDGCWQKIFFPGECWTEEEKKEFIEENWHHYRPTFYDCTGQIFTIGIDVFNVPNGVVAYIREAIDC